MFASIVLLYLGAAISHCSSKTTVQINQYLFLSGVRTFLNFVTVTDQIHFLSGYISDLVYIFVPVLFICFIFIGCQMKSPTVYSIQMYL